MGIATLVRRTLRFLFWGFDKRLHKARFAAFDEKSSIIASNPPPVSLLVGANLVKQFYVVRPTKARRELGNMLVVAPTRGGKGLLAVSQILTWQGSMIINDIKGDLFTQTAGYRATVGEVFVIDPRGVGHRYDPLQGKHTEEELTAQATRLLYHANEGEGAIFTQRAEAMLTQLFLASRIENAPPLPYVRQIMRTGLKATAEQLHDISPELAIQFLDSALKDADFINDRFLKSAWGTLTNRLKPLLTEHVIRTFAGTDFTPEQLMKSEKPVTVYVRLPEQHLLALSPLVRLIWGSLIDDLIATYDKAEGKGCKPVLLLVDEAGRTAIPTLADQATTVVGRGISLWLAVQSISQLEVVYGKERAQVLKDNTDTQLYYRPTDVATADYLEHRVGKKSAYDQSTTESQGARTSRGESEQGIPLVTAQTIMQMKAHDVIVFYSNLPPLKARRMDWRNYQTLIQRRELTPPKLSTLPDSEPASLTHTHNLLFPTNGYIDAEMILTQRHATENTRREIN